MSINSISSSNYYPIKNNNVKNESSSKTITENQNFDKYIVNNNNKNSISLSGNDIHENYSKMQSENVVKRNVINQNIEVSNEDFKNNVFRNYDMFDSKPVFDLSKSDIKLENKLAHPYVEVSTYAEGLTQFSCCVVEPKTNRLVEISIAVQDFEGELPMDEVKFKETIGKAIQIYDKLISAHSKLGDVIPDEIGGEVSKDLDISACVEHARHSITGRLEGKQEKSSPFINFDVNSKTLMEVMQEFDEFLLNLGFEDKENEDLNELKNKLYSNKK